MTHATMDPIACVREVETLQRVDPSQLTRMRARIQEGCSDTGEIARPSLVQSPAGSNTRAGVGLLTAAADLWIIVRTARSSIS